MLHGGVETPSSGPGQVGPGIPSATHSVDQSKARGEVVPHAEQRRASSQDSTRRAHAGGGGERRQQSQSVASWRSERLHHATWSWSVCSVADEPCCRVLACQTARPDPSPSNKQSLSRRSAAPSAAFSSASRHSHFLSSDQRWVMAQVGNSINQSSWRGPCGGERGVRVRAAGKCRLNNIKAGDQAPPRPAPPSAAPQQPHTANVELAIDADRLLRRLQRR